MISPCDDLRCGSPGPWAGRALFPGARERDRYAERGRMVRTDSMSIHVIRYNVDLEEGVVVAPK